MSQTTLSKPSTAFELKPEMIKSTVPACFEERVRQHPQRLAVQTATHHFTYELLNRIANQIAWAIIEQLGDGEARVASLLQTHPLTIPALFGILKAGKTWVPIDPSHPQARIAYIFEDAAVSLILTDNEQLETARTLAQPDQKILNIDQLTSTLPEASPSLHRSPDDLAFILYTSGSTGHPKGVMENHRSLLHGVFAYIQSCCLTPEDRLALLTSLSFVAGFRDVLRALLSGASITPYPLKTRGLVGLADWLITEKITLYHFVPTLFRHFIDTLTGQTFPDVRLVHLGGEAVSAHDLALFKQHFPPHCVLLNNISSTEIACYRQFFATHETEIKGDLVPIGYPVADKQVLLLDEQGQPTPPGEVGEIVVKSPYLALGYWDRPELTAQVFLPDPEGSPDRICHTGDLGRMDPDGCLYHLGRKDNQVKVRGQRVELGEIEATLHTHPAVKEVAVIAHTEAETYLAAYMVPVSGRHLTDDSLRTDLRQKLPDYMIPATFTLLDEMPLLPNGKINRLELAKRQQTRPVTPFVAPQTPIEEMLAGVWQTVLGVEQVGRHDNFFELGGHSLLAMRVVSHLSQMHEFELSLQHLFDHPTLADLALTITLNQAETLDQEDLEGLLAELESLPDNK